MKVIYYTAPCYMDMSIEIINVLKNVVDLHVIIELTPTTLNQTIFSIDSLPVDETLVDIESLVSGENYKILSSYLEGTASAKFLVFKNKSFFSSFKVGFELNNYLKTIKPEVFHLEALLFRSLFLLPSFFSFKKLFLSIHDPLPHVGEKDFKVSFIKKLYLNHPKLKGIFFYSKFALQQFQGYYKNSKLTYYTIKMHPFSFYKNFLPDDAPKRSSILFFGRISRYKGVEVLVSAFSAVLNDFPNEQLVIAGRSINNYTVTTGGGNEICDSVKVINEHISNESMALLISQAKFVVCPYLEATQSGVLQTSFALDTPVIASSVGAFVEYIDEGVNGFLTPARDAESLAREIKRLLEDQQYVKLIQNIREGKRKKSWTDNVPVLLGAYRKN